jgi:SNF2 family DNA or RNA helicase
MIDFNNKKAEFEKAEAERQEKEYQEQLKKQEEEHKELNKNTVFSAMSLMRIAASCPDFINVKLERAGCDQKIYTGPPGGGKMQQVFNLVWTKVQNGEKVVVYAYHKHMVDVLANELKIFNPIKFDTKWDEEERFDWQEKFNDPDSGYNVWVCTLDSVQVAVDLSGANTVICTDLLWVQGNQDQAYKRIMRPMPGNRQCEIYFTLLKHSIDQHIYSVFYAKLTASEQAMDRIVKTKKDKGFNVEWFVDKVMSDRAHIVEYMLEAGEEQIDYVPMLEMLWQDDRE